MKQMSMSMVSNLLCVTWIRSLFPCDIVRNKIRVVRRQVPNSKKSARLHARLQARKRGSVPTTPKEDLKRSESTQSMSQSTRFTEPCQKNYGSIITSGRSSTSPNTAHETTSVEHPPSHTHHHHQA